MQGGKDLRDSGFRVAGGHLANIRSRRAVIAAVGLDVGTCIKDLYVDCLHAAILTMPMAFKALEKRV